MYDFWRTDSYIFQNLYRLFCYRAYNCLNISSQWYPCIHCIFRKQKYAQCCVFSQEIICATLPDSFIISCDRFEIFYLACSWKVQKKNVRMVSESIKTDFNEFSSPFRCGGNGVADVTCRVSGGGSCVHALFVSLIAVTSAANMADRITYATDTLDNRSFHLFLMTVKQPLPHFLASVIQPRPPPPLYPRS